MPVGKVRLAHFVVIPENVHVKIRSRLQGISVSVHGSGSLAGHGHLTQLQATHEVAVPAITDQPVGWAVPASYSLLQCKGSQEARLASFVQVGESHSQDAMPIPVLGVLASSWLCRNIQNFFQMLETHP